MCQICIHLTFKYPFQPCLIFSWPLLFLSALEKISSTSSLVQATLLSCTMQCEEETLIVGNDCRNCRLWITDAILLLAILCRFKRIELKTFIEKSFDAMLDTLCVHNSIHQWCFQSGGLRPTNCIKNMIFVLSFMAPTSPWWLIVCLSMLKP